jgi:hypothetical protein
MVAKADSALANSSRKAPKNAGASSGPPTYRQYCQVDEPRLSDASRHWSLSPSMAGRNTSTMSGIWK